MSTREPRRALAGQLADAADAYQRAEVIPHCASCSKPCCKLESLVLELEWKQLKSFWRIELPRKAFDHQLAAGQGPEEIRAGNGLYYIHGKPCPAYNLSGASCSIYGQALKPVGCSDFPVYEDQDAVIADLRCEAVDIDALAAWIARAVGPAFRVVRSADAEFPFLVTLSVRKVSGKNAAHKRTSR